MVTSIFTYRGFEGLKSSVFHWAYKSKFFGFCLILIFCCNIPKSQATTCEYYLNNGPISRATGFNEEHIVSGLYSGLAQRYNNLSGQMTGIRFWARAIGTAQNMRAILYQENVGFPGTIIAQATVSVPASATWQQIDAVFPSPATVSGNVILSIEPSSPSTNNVWVQHNLEGNASNNYIGNGGNLYLNLVKQGVTWYKDLANGDPSWDYDFMILPIRTVNITPGFSFNANNLAVNFTNTSTNASTYSWNFGDGATANTANASHTYATSGTYQVKLVVGGPSGSGCADSISQTVVVTNTAIDEVSNWFENPTYESATNQISFQSLANQTCYVYSAEGRLLDEFKVAKNESIKRTIPSTNAGMYLLKSSLSNQSFRFIINGYSK